MQPVMWRTIPGYEGYYIVSSAGTISSVTRTIPLDNGTQRKLPNKEVLQRVDRAGYFTVRLSKQGHSKTHFVHRIVALSFLPNPEAKPYVNHLNGDKKDNRVSNLEWCDHAENIQHAYLTGLIKSKAKKVIDTCSGLVFPSSAEAAIYYELPINTVRNYLNGGIKNNPTCLKYLNDSA